MKKLLFIALLLWSFNGSAQTAQDTIKFEPYTIVTKAGTTKFKVQTSDVDLAEAMVENYGFRIKNMTVYPKKDRYGDYWIYTITFLNEELGDVMYYLKTTHKPKKKK